MPASGETIGDGEFKVYSAAEKDFVPRRVGLTHYCRLYHSANQSIASGAGNVPLAFNSEIPTRAGCTTT
ncbi:MAG TPA: hypothetical protein VN228_15270 [Pyrinomonadaceae bacterium]|nr:hypothetical protein [Pyrinomonadaceae bacterium]